MVGARVRRQQVAYARQRGLSSRRACALLSVARSTLGYRSRLQQRDAPRRSGVEQRLAGQADHRERLRQMQATLWQIGPGPHPPDLVPRLAMARHQPQIGATDQFRAV